MFTAEESSIPMTENRNAKRKMSEVSIKLSSLITYDTKNREGFCRIKFALVLRNQELYTRFFKKEWTQELLIS